MNSIIKKILLIGIAICSISTIYSQNKIVYFDENFDTVSKAQAAYYRTGVKFNNSRYEFKDYYIDGTLQFEGGSSSATE
ncbi:MAG: hypothetical protein IPO21_20295, partial [Bacteroidales bacterium]|nr:hypothetical protein [Bacteroidales bacterium]